MWISDFKCYRRVLKTWIENQPAKGRGQLSQLAKYLEVSPVNISQILNFEREIPVNLALKTTRFMDFSEFETDYFLLLVEIARSKDDELTQFLNKKLVKFKKQNTQIKSQLKHRELTTKEQSQFYSSYLYSSIRMCSDIAHLNSSEEIANYLGVNRNLITEKLNFLLETGLIKIDNNKKMSMGTSITHAGHDATYANNHHKNWRLKALESITNTKPDKNWHYTGPMVLSQESALKVKEKLTKLLKDVVKEVKTSPSEAHYCLNIDWFELGGL